MTEQTHKPMPEAGAEGTRRGERPAAPRGVEHGAIPAEDGPPALDFDAWAAMAARLLGLHAEERLEALQQHDIEPEEWDASDKYWAGLLAREIGAGDLGRAGRYARGCAEELARRRAASEARAAVASSDVAETAVCLRPIQLPPLPFAAGQRVPSPGPIVAASDERPDLVGETAELSALVAPAEPLPFVPDLPLEHYAALCARLALRPGDAVATASAYGVGNARQLEAVHAAWRARFEREHELRARFTQLEQHYRRALQPAER